MEQAAHGLLAVSALAAGGLVAECVRTAGNHKFTGGERQDAVVYGAGAGADGGALDTGAGNAVGTGALSPEWMC